MYMNIYVYIVRPMFIALPAVSKAVTCLIRAWNNSRPTCTWPN